ncbi:MAG: hypothetical protein QOJ15_6235 [Bradyrhizobium sp.]|jgi:hypothetical protein|nr:hypothetical protein [Bradyrhizobium sp.]
MAFRRRRSGRLSDRHAHLRLNVIGWSAAGNAAIAFGCARRKRRIRFGHQRWVGCRRCTKNLYKAYQWPVLGIEVQGSAGGLASPFCNSSIECRSGERTKAIWPSRGGRLMVMPIFISRSQVA